MARETWTDERLDDFGKHVDHRFDAVDHRFDAVDHRFDEVDRRLDEVDRRFDRVEDQIRDSRSEASARFEKTDTRLDSIQRTMVQAAIVMTGSILAGFAAICAVIAMVV